MNRLVAFFVFLALGVMVAPAAVAANLNVAVGGSDTSGDGSPGAPYATVSHALSVCSVVGDVIGGARHVC